ncbi:uncharacterized protein VTP21DRAFT_8028 [Calcarisporiella thermophila]|uniref:uncharacterized protein n=1 Tax=Calcarisporiella thermophila TaxID=911321 RepID=UPI0037438047
MKTTEEKCERVEESYSNECISSGKDKEKNGTIDYGHVNEKDDTSEKESIKEFVEVWQIGWTFGAHLFGAIFGFAVLKPLSRILPASLGGGRFGPRENCTVQTAATAAGGLGAGFVSAIPAMYKLGLLTDLKRDMGALTLWTISAAFYWLFFAVPLRKHFVINQDLVFPTPRATANTIQSLHASTTGEKEAMKKAYWLGIWFIVTFLWTLIAFWIPGLFEDTHILYWIGYALGNENVMVADALWKWHFKWEFAFFGAGLMTPGATVWSFFVGQVIAYGITGPLMLQNGIITQPYGFTENPTAQSWWLWPGIALMVFSSFSEIFIHYKSLWSAVKLGGRELAANFNRLMGRSTANYVKDIDPKDPIPPHEQVPLLWWSGGLVVSIIFTCAIMGVMFGMAVHLTLLAIILSFLLSFIGLQSSGDTGINPVGSIGKVTQLIFAAIPNPVIQNQQMINLMAGNIAGSAASQSVEMVGDLKTGQLLKASPRSQFFAQIIGSFFAILMAISLFYLYASAYPCITAPMGVTEIKCEFELFAAKVWASVTKLLTQGATIPKSSFITAIVFSGFAVMYTLIKGFLVPEKFRKYMPNLNAMGIGLIQKGPEVPIAMVIGWIITKVWHRVNPIAWDKYMYSVAAGTLAGVGISSVFKAFFQLGGIKGSTVTFGCLLNKSGVPEC